MAALGWLAFSSPVRRPAGRSQSSNGGLRRALREPLQADCAREGDLRQSVTLLACNASQKNRCCVAVRCSRNMVETPQLLRLTLLIPLLVSIRAGRTTGPKRRAVR